ncbi:competence type IV pilus minor pilin ComGG [Neobacillus sp. PS3-34]|uniref:competence type IV pilus minor pilin ComGG n=1 Tax=Neobacillus sp. PS3-34 TaxID=3070678 RepID=UPI0027E15FF9|nr:competence type IV pilus minor pilin ComGG [Neobacillus sp. PS3-34]WML47538.1 competence type IV pilus minor pilin ComGG [Neobacillus sp. PS3-34]
MKRNGFTYPLTLCILIVFLLFIASHIEQHITERKLTAETKKILREEYYMMASMKKTEKMLQAGDQKNGIYQFNSGRVAYQMELLPGGVQKITFNLTLNSGETALGYGYFDNTAKKMVKWIEKN